MLILVETFLTMLIMIKKILYLLLILSGISSYCGYAKTDKSSFLSYDIKPPANIQITNISQNSATVNWALNSNANFYMVRFRIANTNSAWLTIQISSNQSFCIINGLMSCTTYEVQVADYVGSGSGSYSSSLFFTTLVPDACVSASVDSSQKNISNVTVTPFSGSGLSAMVSNSAASNYTDYKPDPTRKITLITGSVNNIVSVTKSGTLNSSDAVTVWIDFNGDGIFSDNERIMISNAASSTVISNFSVPASVAKCDVTMRVIYSASTVQNACGNFAAGEVEDYSVHFTTLSNLGLHEAEISDEILAYPNPVKDTLYFTISSLDYNYEIYNTTGQIMSKGKLYNKSLDVKLLPKGIYFISLLNKEKNVRLKFIKN